MTYRGYFTSGTATVEVRAIDVDGEAVPVAELIAALQEQRSGVARLKSATTGDTCVCPECGRQFARKKGNACADRNCPDCDVALVDGKKKAEAAMSDLEEAVTKTVGGKSYPASDFLVVEDSEKPSTWRLQVRRNGVPNHRLMGAAKAALTSPRGFRGNKYEGPDKQKAIGRLKALYKGEEMEWSESAHEVEGMNIDVVGLRDLLQQALYLFDPGEGMAEAVAGSLEDYASRVRDAFNSAFRRRSESGMMEGPWARDVFSDDPDLGNSVVVRDNGKLYAVGYEEGEDGFTFSDRGQWQEVVQTYKRVGGTQTTEEMGESEFAESATGHAIGLTEASAVDSGPRSPLVMEVALITPGWGNQRDKHYYPAEILKRDIGVFEGVKMYATDHRPDEKSVRTEVAVIKTCPSRFLGDGTPVAIAAVHDGDFAEATRNRAQLGTLKSLECSILAAGQTRRGKAPDGKEGNIVEAITKGRSVDWVTKAGAGGHAIALAETDTGGVNMDKKQMEKLLSESGLPQDVQERLARAEYDNEEAVKEAILQEKAQSDDAPQTLAAEEVKTLLSESTLPSVSKQRLAEQAYEDESAVRKAILAEIEYLKVVTGSGEVFGQGQSAASQQEEKSLDELLDEVDRQHGITRNRNQEV